MKRRSSRAQTRAAMRPTIPLFVARVSAAGRRAGPTFRLLAGFTPTEPIPWRYRSSGSHGIRPAAGRRRKDTRISVVTRPTYT